MKFNHLCFLIVTCLFIATGCVRLPSPTFSASPSSATPTRNDALATAGAFVRANQPGQAALIVTGSPAKQAIQRAVNWMAVLCTIGGVACLAFAALLGYGGQVIPAIKVGLAGLLLPIFGIWFAYHWLAVVIGALIISAAIFLATHFAIVRPVIQRLENLSGKTA